MQRVMVVAGTRPEVIKLAPVLRALRARPSEFETIYCNSGQHREMAKQANEVFGLRADIDLDVMTESQTLPSLTAALLSETASLFGNERPDAVLVQGDTTTAFVAALAAFYAQIPVGHVEAGLRTGDLSAPFPEEANRQFIARIATWNFAPTESARRNLLAEGVAAGAVYQTGNTIVDALRWICESESEQASRALRALFANGLPDEYILVTMHRRETIGAGHVEVAKAARKLLERHAGLHLLFPVHPNPAVREPITEMLGSHPRVALLPPMPYAVMLQLIANARLVMSDSGGVQEEAPSFGVPVVVLREKTERHELIESGFGVLTGTDGARIEAAAEALLQRRARNAQEPNLPNPFGDGLASVRIVEIIAGSRKDRELLAARK
jgi:UDP-N-acetylglucosamine 2-epimerase (non-hydrolysing)